ncbi:MULTISPECIES: homocysteine S-methyltransferase family protein [unclassified Novosphingobium]|uniref:homocysteine S-methyltransferase family protein n=1 Tax=unclassified Novosphingobium TaxID=2644732 RepID=UPI000EE19A75|nr:MULTISPECIES: homocysteine S-methyltransferase family protein [unclassified Novosphingobium]HCF24611.1 homocysteine S-methyltransferase [Novosphingobium sp.]HQV04257.1 homocysteine S-methyltransferase family protein [Novosphingobium sp.]
MNLTILDGGMGRELQRSGAPFRQPEWSALALIEAPEAVTRAHQSFVAAGAKIITTNSYALVPFHIGEARFAAQGQALAALAGRLAREVAEQSSGVRVAGSLPPLFGSYRPDLFDPDRAVGQLAPLICGLSPYVDLWLAETLSATSEAQAVALALGDDARPRWYSFTLRDDADAHRTAPRLRSGESIEKATAVAIAGRADALLFNCSQPEVMASAVQQARAAIVAAGVNLAVGVYANAFPPQKEEAAANEDLLPLRADLDPPGYLAWARKWLDAGASIIGGCCGIGPEHIAEIAAGLLPPSSSPAPPAPSLRP